MDIPLMRHCLPNVIYYCGIEPRINAIDKFQDNLLKNGSKDLCIKVIYTALFTFFPVLELIHVKLLAKTNHIIN